MASSGCDGDTPRRPVLGLSTYLQPCRSGVWDVEAGFLPAGYIRGITAAGGIATLLPPQPVDTALAERVLDGLDGLVLTGGRDVDPARYGRPRHRMTDEPATDRDAWEFALLAAALRRDLPVLGICRGAQVLNVALGGTLHQHLPEVLGHTGHRVGDAVFATSVVQVLAGSRLAALIGTRSVVSCYHHQGIDRVGDGLVVTARDGDGMIEAVEADAAPFCLAVQWHPEERPDDRALFAGVVAAAARYAQEGVRR